MKKSLLENVQNSNLPGVYKITRISDGKVYIGQTSTSIKQRLEQHINNVRVEEESDSIDSAIKKEGAEKFKYETIIALPDAQTEQLWFLEALYIEQYDSYNNGFNKTKGNHKGVYDALDLRNKHKVSLALCKKIEKDSRLDFEDKRVLLIGNFDRRFVNYCEYNASVVEAIDAYETHEFMEKFNEVIGSMENKEFDIIISNPPYGKLGVEITKRIIDEVSFEDFVNLLPARDYIKFCKEKVFQYIDISSLKTISNGFDDAATVTQVARIQKVPNLYISKEEFTVETYEDRSLKKYFYGGIHRKHYAIDDFGKFFDKPLEEVFDKDKTVIFGFRDVANGHMPYSKNVSSYKFNFEKSVDAQYMIDNHWSSTGNFGKGQISYNPLMFDTPKEKDNFVKFMYSEDGFRFMSKLFTAVNTDGGSGRLCMPKVNWKKEWTVEEILKDYGYTDKEIEEVMEDLKNFKGMNE